MSHPFRASREASRRRGRTRPLLPRHLARFVRRLAGLVGIGLAVLFAVVSASLMFFLPEWIARMYTSEREVIELAASLLMLAAIFQVSDGLQVASASA